MSDWLLEMMEATAAEVESEKEKELLAKASSQSSNDKAANDDDGFIACKDGNSSGARGPNIILYNTVVKAVELDRLVWAKCIYYKGNKPFFPARICDNSEGALLPPKEIGNEWPIPPNKALVQYISLTKKPHNTYEYALLGYSLTHLTIYSLTHLTIYSLTHPPNHLLTHSPTHTYSLT